MFATRAEWKMKMSKSHGMRYMTRPALYNELKKCLNLTLTPTAIARLEECAQAWKLSKSALVEQIARGIIPLPNPQDFERLEETSIKKMPSSETNSTDDGISKSRKPKEVQALINAALR